MSGLIKWIKASVPVGNPPSGYVYAGIDSSDGLFYLKNEAGALTKFPTLATIQSLAGTVYPVTAALNNSSNTTLTNIAELAFPVTAGKKYAFKFVIMFRSAATATGITLGINTTNTAVGSIAAQVNLPTGGDGSNNMYAGNVTSLGDLVTTPTVEAANTDYIAIFEGVFVCTTSGNLAPQFRSEINGSQVTIQAGSYGLIREL